MTSTAPSDAPLGYPRALQLAIDMPAREALRITRRSLTATLAPAMLGAALVAASSLAARVIGPPHPRYVSAALERVDLLRAVFEALLVVVPSALVLGSYLRLSIGARAILASFAIGLLHAGVVAAALVPLVAFLGIVSRAQPMLSPGLLLPPIAVATVAATVARIVRSVDPSARARVAIIVINTSLFAVFAVRGLALL